MLLFPVGYKVMKRIQLSELLESADAMPGKMVKTVAWDS